MFKSVSTNISNPRSIFFLILAVQLVIMLAMSQDVGISADESRHYKQAEKVYNYYKTDGEDKSALEKTGIDPMQYNGQSFDNLMYFIEKKFHVNNNMEMRHLFNSIIGWLIILLTGLILKELWGFKEACIAILLLFISPRFLGHALNNNKDIPFAFGFILSFYGMIRFFKETPKPKLLTIAILTMGIAYAISIRLAGLISIAFLGLFGVTYFFSRKPLFSFFYKKKLKIFSRFFIFIPVICVAGYFIGIAFWPFMMEAPIEHIKEVMNATSSHPISLNQLFEGNLILSNHLPHYYALKYLSITYPLVIILGIALFILLVVFNLKRQKTFYYFMITFAFIFVFTWMSLKNSNFYGGIRHLLFIYPLAVCLAVLGFKFLEELVTKFKVKWLKYFPSILLILLCITPVAHLIKNYPYSYVYFNELAGSTKRAATQFETDYFQHSLKHATEWFKENELSSVDKDSVVIITNDNFNTSYYLKDVSNKTRCNYSRYYDKASKDWDYAIFYCGYITPQQLQNGLWPPKGTIHTEKVNGFPIAAVVKRISYEDIKGFKALETRKLNEAQDHFTKFLKVCPESEQVLDAYARTMLMQRKMDSALHYTDLALKYNPRQIGSYLTKASVYNTQKKFKEAIEASNEMLKIKETFAEGHYQKGFALKNLNQPTESLKEFQIAAAHKKEYYMAYMQMGEILMNYKQYKKAQNVYKQILTFKEGDAFATIFSARCNHFLKDNKKALSLIESLPVKQQNNLESVKLKCRIAMNNNDMNTAGRYLNMARNINNNSDLMVVRAMYLQKQNNKDTCLKFLERAKELNPNNREAQEMYKLVNSKKTVAYKTSTKSKTSSKSVMFQKPKSKKTKGFSVPAR